MKIPCAGLHVLADDDERWPHDPVSQARAACAGGAHVIQLRVKHATDARALEWALAIRELTRDCGATFVVNDRFDLALASGADAVHLGQTDIAPDRVPEGVREHLAIGFSTHTVEQAQEASRLPVDYVAFGPVFGTTSKESEYELRGLEALRRVVDTVAPRPLIAIGGIHAGNLAEVIATAAAGAALISAVAGADDPVTATRELARQFPAEGSGNAESAETAGR